MDRPRILGGARSFAGCFKIIAREPQPAASFGLRTSPGRTEPTQASGAARTCGYTCYLL